MSKEIQAICIDCSNPINKQIKSTLELEAELKQQLGVDSGTLIKVKKIQGNDEFTNIINLFNYIYNTYCNECINKKIENIKGI